MQRGRALRLDRRRRGRRPAPRPRRSRRSALRRRTGRRSCRRRARPRGSRGRPSPAPRSSAGRRTDGRASRPVSSRSSASRSNASPGPVASRSTLAPYPRVARDLRLARAAPHDEQRVESLLGRAPGDGLRVVSRPRSPMTPRAFSSGVSDASFVSTPRGLNEPVRWRSSALRKHVRPERPGPRASASGGAVPR